MKSIIFDMIPRDYKAFHDAQPSNSQINGGYVFYCSAILAMLAHSAYDRFIFLSQRQRLPFSLADNEAFKNCPKDVRIVHPSEISNLTSKEDTVLVTPSERPATLLRLRQMFKSERLPVVGFVHATVPEWLGPFLLELTLAGMREYDAMICSTKASQKVMQALKTLVWPPNARASAEYDFASPLIPGGVNCLELTGRSENARQELGFAADDVVILFFGRFENSGKVDLGPLLVAFSRLKRKTGRQIRLLLAGADRSKLSPLVAQFAVELGCHEDVVIQVNPTNQDKVKLFGAADIFLCPGDAVAESFGLTTVEAMASGLPCVVSDWDGYRETVVHGETGFLVPTSWSNLGPCVDAFQACGISPGTTLAATTVFDVEAVENYLGLLIDSPELRLRMGERARKYALTHFDWPVVVRQYDELFDQLSALARHAHLLSPERQEIARLSSTQGLFSHYPTHVIQPESALLVTEIGKEWMRSPFSLGAALSRQELINDELCRQIAEQFQKADFLTFGELIRRASEATGAASWLVQINTMRLLKYGILGNAGRMSDESQDEHFSRVPAPSIVS